jgi:hypothetical protein
MADLDDVMAKVKEMSIEDLSILRAELEVVTRDKALSELSRREHELNELRQMAGMKRKPIKRADKEVAPPVKRGKK